MISLRSGATAAVAATAVLLGGATAFATDPELPVLPQAVGRELSPLEEQRLDDLLDDRGPVRVAALVGEGNGARVITVQARGEAEGRQAAQLLAAQGSVLGADVDRQTALPPEEVQASPDADLTPQQWGNARVRSRSALGTLSPAATAQVVVAVLDTGIDTSHPDLAAVTLPGQDFSGSPHGTQDVDGHGTHVAGTVAAVADGAGVEGVAAGVRVVPVKVLGDSGTGYSSWVASGITWAADNGADVITMSLGASSPSSVESAAVQYARSKGVPVIASAGNNGTTGNAVSYPAAYPGVLAVASTTSTDARSSFSSAGHWVDVTAPGSSIVSTYPGSRWVGMSGTSMAAPHVAAVAALVRAAAPSLLPDAVDSALLASVTDLGPAGRDDEFGAGLVDAPRALDAARVAAGLPPVGSDPAPAPAPAPVSGTPSEDGTLMLVSTAPHAVLGKRYGLVAVLADPSSVGRKGVPVTLQVRDGSGWTTVKTARTGNGGVVAFGGLPTLSRTAQLRVTGDGRTSATLLLPAVAPVALRARAVRGGPVTLVVTTPTPDAAVLRVQTRPLGTTTWGPASTLAGSSNGKARTASVPLAPGKHEVRVVRAAGGGLSESASGVVKVAVG